MITIIDHWLLIIDHWLLIIDYWSLIIDFWLLTVDCWLLIVDCWLLIVDCWLLLIMIFISINPDHNTIIDDWPNQDQIWPWSQAGNPAGTPSSPLTAVVAARFFSEKTMGFRDVGIQDNSRWFQFEIHSFHGHIPTSSVSKNGRISQKDVPAAAIPRRLWLPFRGETLLWQ